MKYIAVIVSLAVGLVFTNTSIAGDVDDIKKITLEHFATLSSGDVEAHVAHHHKGHTTFAADGSLLQVDDSQDEEKKNLQATLDAAKLNLQVRHLDVQVYGNTAVVTGYVVGTSTPPDGMPQQVMNRRTAVLIKQGNQWQEVHVHNSPVVAADSQ